MNSQILEGYPRAGDKWKRGCEIASIDLNPAYDYNEKQDCLSIVVIVMVTDEKPQILNCNILFYFKWIVHTITFKLWDN